MNHCSSRLTEHPEEGNEAGTAVTITVLTFGVGRNDDALTLRRLTAVGESGVEGALLAVAVDEARAAGTAG